MFETAILLLAIVVLAAACAAAKFMRVPIWKGALHAVAFLATVLAVGGFLPREHGWVVIPAAILVAAIVGSALRMKASAIATVFVVQALAIVLAYEVIGTSFQLQNVQSAPS